MSYSLKVKNGDLAIGGGRSLETVSGRNKLSQDFRLALTERRGSDPYHPEFGTAIDDASGDEISLLGRDSEYVLAQLRAEVDRLRRNYQLKQIERIRSDQSKFKASTLRREEILVSAEIVGAYQFEDKLKVSIKLVSGTQVEENITFLI